MLGGFRRVVFSLYMMAMRQVSVMTSFLVFACVVVFCGGQMVPRSLLMMFRCLAMMFGAFVGHRDPLFVDSEAKAL